MKQVKIVDTSNMTSIESKINVAIRELIESGRALSSGNMDIKITMNHNLVIGMIIYDSADYIDR